MEATLLTAGLACVIAAIIGGGIKAWGIEIPAFTSVKRQLLLVSFGGLLLLTLIVVRLSKDARATSYKSSGAGPSDASQGTKPVVQPSQTQSPAAEIGTTGAATGKQVSAVAAESRLASMSGTRRDSTASLAKAESPQGQTVPGKTTGTALGRLWMGEWVGFKPPDLQRYTLDIRADGGRLSYSDAICDKVLTLTLHETFDPLTISYEVTGDSVTRSNAGSLCDATAVFDESLFDKSAIGSRMRGEIKGTAGFQELKMSHISVPLKRAVH